MANFKVNNIVPDVGEIKVGTANVSKIFQGATLVWPITQGGSPGTSTVCGGNIAWTTANSTITATTTGPAIQIVESVSEWNTAYANQTPAAAYYNYASADATEPRGLYYNEFAVAVIQPPTGFRVPTSNDRAALLIASCIDLSVNPVNLNSLAIAGGNWDTSVYTNTTFRGDSGLNINAFGHIDAGTRDFARNTIVGSFWIFSSSTNDFRAQVLGRYSSSNTQNYITGNLVKLVGDGYNIRFAKDV
tara:strand:+ start:279 stop:1016 length:738 start_codon:yes stop_codon:yes gene_type:complete